MITDLMVGPLAPRVMEYVEFQTGTLEMLSAHNVMSDFSPALRCAPLAVVINSMDRTRAAKAIGDRIRADFRAHHTVRLLDTVVPSTKAYQVTAYTQT